MKGCLAQLFVAGIPQQAGAWAQRGSERRPSATRNQRGPTGITKVEDTHVFGSSFFLTGSYGFVDGGAELIAVGGAGPRPTSIYRSWPTRFSAGRRTIASDWLQPRVSAALP